MFIELCIWVVEKTFNSRCNWSNNDRRVTDATMREKNRNVNRKREKNDGK